MTPCDTAQYFYQLGISTIPCWTRSKRPAIDHWQPYQTTLPSPSSILSWYSQERNIGVICGGATHLTVLDFDTQEGYRKWRRWATAQGGLARQVAHWSYQVRTSRGVHVYVRLARSERCRHLPGIDIKAQGGYVIGEGSIHESGAIYTRLTPAMTLMRVEALSDVLPTVLLLQAPDLPSMVTSSARLICSAQFIDDPWTLASTPPLLSGTGVLERIKRQFNVGDFFPQNQATSRDGRWRMTQCPFHDDAHPSFWLDTERNLCGCFSGCTPKPLDVIDLYGWLYGLSNQAAIRELAHVTEK